MRRNGSLAVMACSIVLGSLLITPVASASPALVDDELFLMWNDGSAQAIEEPAQGRSDSEQPAYSPSFEGSGEPLAVGDVATPSDEGADPDTSDLEAQFREEFGLESAGSKVIGADDRVQITTNTSSPYRSIVQISYSLGGIYYRCTGWLYGARDVVTNGHCLYDKDEANPWAQGITVRPGRAGDSTPYGVCGAASIATNSVWASSEDIGYDYGYIRLSCTVGNSTGWFGMRQIPDGATSELAIVTGYPGDKPGGNTQWSHSQPVYDSITTHVTYQTDTAPGQSGSPVWNAGTSCGPCVIAIHNVALNASELNHGVRITASVFNALMTWKNAA